MRIVLLNQFYPPDLAPTGVMLESVAKQLVANGHDVTILCASNAYAGHHVPLPISPEADAITINRIRVPSIGGRSAIGKLLSYLCYCLGLAWSLLWQKADLVVMMTTPPYLSVIGRLFTKFRGARIAHWVMDLYPDVMTAYGMIPQGGYRDRILRSIARWGFGGRRSRLILTLGPDMAARVSRLTGPQNQPCEWIPLWGTVPGHAEQRRIEELRRERNWGQGETIFVYSGNMGLGHRFAEFIEAARSLSPDCGIRLAYFGNGGRKKEIAALLADWRDGPHSIDGYVDAACLAAHLQTADVHLASLEPAWDGTMLPSKLQGIFAAGRPVIFTGSKTGSMGQWILESGAGWVCEPGDIEAHRQAILEAMDPEVRRRRGAAALEYSNQHFNRDKNVQRIAALLEKCVQ